MELNRNHYFMVGIVILLVGIQFRVVDSYLLTEEASKIVTKYVKKAKAEAKQEAGPTFMFFNAPPAVMIPKQHKMRPPKFIGWLLVSAGAVLILHSLAMKRPE